LAKEVGENDQIEMIARVLAVKAKLMWVVCRTTITTTSPFSSKTGNGE